jgi:predicted molibdopterin-dependent oxidoreductase YjgC
MRRIEDGVWRPEAVTIEVDGETVAAYPGESVAAALLAAGRRTFRMTQTGAVRGPFCNMGVCFDCLVEVDGARARACMTAVQPAMKVRTGARAAS